MPNSESLLDVFYTLAMIRCKPMLLLPHEWSAYITALKQGGICQRMAVASQVNMYINSFI